MPYRSNSEEAFAIALTDDRIRFKYEADRISYTVIKKYIPDFYLVEYNFYIEFKGYFRPRDRRKWAEKIIPKQWLIAKLKHS